MRKTITILIVAIIILGGAYYFWGQPTPLPDADLIPQAPPPPAPPTLIQQLQNMTVRVPELNLETKLDQGTSGFALPDLPGGMSGSIAVGNVSTIHEVNNLLAVLVVNSGGTGTFNYLTLFTKNNGALEQQESVFLGDRINITTITTQAGISEGEFLVEVSYLDRAENEAMAAEPTIPVKKRFIVKNNSFELTE